MNECVIDTTAGRTDTKTHNLKNLPAAPQYPNHRTPPPMDGGDFDDDPSMATWDLSELLDFTTDDPLPIPNPWDHPHQATPLPEPPNLIATPPREPDPSVPAPSRVRKRDPRLVCSNYRARRVPCACPEVDEKAMEEEEEEGRVSVVATAGKKRARRVGNREKDAVVRCQVEGCGADIRELKGYHRRHRVCLWCANAASVVVEGESKRYCQQCGKFHILSNFDEGKRSCRRKLEHHNKRRRRKPAGSCVQVEKELPQDVHPVDDGCGGDAGKDNLCISSPSDEKETLFDPDDGRISAPSSALESQSVPVESIPSFEASHEAQLHNRKDNSKYSVSPSYCDNRNVYSSVCPTGRISFKLYDWNPAEFPRCLRHQIFQWLSSMPIELEGYIRPGCTILTIFIAMPKFMWGKVYEDPALYLRRFILQPGSMLPRKGTVFVNIDDTIFHVVGNGNAVVKLKREVPAPRLHYVRPIFFEAGKPIEFVACGSDLFQPKLRFLVSFAGKYLSCDCSPHCPCRQKSGCINCKCNHQSFKINVPPTEHTLYGPAFIEVENQSGLSNFVPVLIGDKEVCSEMRLLQQKADNSLKGNHKEFPGSGDFPNSCDAFLRRQTMLADFVTDIAWLLKEPASENQLSSLTSFQIERFTLLLNFLIQNESVVILEKTLQNLKLWTDKLNADLVGSNKTSVILLEAQMDNARDHLKRKHLTCGSTVQHSGCSCSKKGCPMQDFSQIDVLTVASNEDREMAKRNNGGAGGARHEDLISIHELKATPLLDAESTRNSNLLWVKHCNPVIRSFSSRSRPTVYLIATAAVCLGICTVLLHPNKVGEVAVSVHRSLFD